MRGEPRKLGERELDIMRVLWRLGRATVAEVQEALRDEGHDVAYTTVQTMLNRLEAKGRVARDTSGKAHRYRSRLKEPTAAGSAVRSLVDRFFGGSAEALATRLVERDLDDETLDRLQAAIDEQRRRGGAK
jgi:BlaI family transcriptional regulator, penicillinase repressor